MTEKEQIQNRLYHQLISKDMQQISARFVAMELQQLKCTNIDKIQKLDILKYIVTFNNKNYIVSLHPLDLPDASIEKV